MDLIGAYAAELGITRREAAHEVEGLLGGLANSELDSTTESLLDELCDITSHSDSFQSVWAGRECDSL